MYPYHIATPKTTFGSIPAGTLRRKMSFRCHDVETTSFRHRCDVASALIWQCFMLCACWEINPDTVLKQSNSFYMILLTIVVVYSDFYELAQNSSRSTLYANVPFIG